MSIGQNVQYVGLKEYWLRLFHDDYKIIKKSSQIFFIITQKTRNKI
jgi:hypothetical protein